MSTETIRAWENHPAPRRRRDVARTHALSSRTRKENLTAASAWTRAFLFAAAAATADAQSYSAQGGMYYPYGSTVGPLYGYARATRERALSSRTVVPSEKKTTYIGHIRISGLIAWQEGPRPSPPLRNKNF
jgi:hypothetical protein